MVSKIQFVGLDSNRIARLRSQVILDSDFSEFVFLHVFTFDKYFIRHFYHCLAKFNLFELFRNYFQLQCLFLQSILMLTWDNPEVIKIPTGLSHMRYALVQVVVHYTNISHYLLSRYLKVFFAHLVPLHTSKMSGNCIFQVGLTNVVNYSGLFSNAVI